jgi:1,4-dihydroxy-2-naphthoate octaprenyltransferase
MLYAACVVGAFVGALVVAWLRVGGLAVVLAVPLAVMPIQVVRGRASGRDLIPVLAATGRLQLVFGALLAAGIAVG